MSSKIKLSKFTSEELDFLSRKLDLRRNIVCRLAIGTSLSIKTSVSTLHPKDNLGFEFNRYTLTGETDHIFKALIQQHEKKKLSDHEYFTKFFRNHVERGISILKSNYERINSPVDFLLGLNQPHKIIYQERLD